MSLSATGHTAIKPAFVQNFLLLVQLHNNIPRNSDCYFVHETFYLEYNKYLNFFRSETFEDLSAFEVPATAIDNRDKHFYCMGQILLSKISALVEYIHQMYLAQEERKIGFELH